MSNVTCRRHEPSDRNASYEMFRSSVFDYVIRIGLVDSKERDDLAAAWNRQGSMMVHLEASAAEDWVAELDGPIVGLARSVERDGHLELTDFSVHPAAQGMGAGRGVLERAFLGR